MAQTKAFLEELRRKHGLGEFRKGAKLATVGKSNGSLAEQVKQMRRDVKRMTAEAVRMGRQTRRRIKASQKARRRFEALNPFVITP